MNGWWTIAALIGLAVCILGLTTWARPGNPRHEAAKAGHEAAKAKRARYCTKHVIRKSMIPGGPEQLVWLYGPHRSHGNACDGPEHMRKSGWW